jgi:hypothetical protein
MDHGHHHCDYFVNDFLIMILETFVASWALHGFSALLFKGRLTNQKLPSTLTSLYLGVKALALSKEFFPNYLEYPPAAHRLFGIHLGATLYDMMAMGNQHFSVWIHHLLGATGCLLLRHYQIAAYFPICFLAAEATVPISNLLWLLKRKSLVYQWLLVVRFVLFFWLRGLAVPFLLNHVIQCEKALSLQKMSMKEALQRAFHRIIKLPWLVSIPTFGNVVIFAILNVVWTRMTFIAMIQNLKINIHHI